MQVRLTTTITTIIEIDPENTTEFETARSEIFNKYHTAVEQDDAQEQCLEGVKALQAGAVEFDAIVGTEVSHSFEEVKLKEAL